MKILLVVDLQKQFETKESTKVVEYINNNRDKYDIVMGTFFNGGNLNFKRNEFFIEAKKEDILVPCDVIIEKDTYAFNLPLFVTDTCEVDIVGCDLDACILATCYMLWDEGIRFRILKDYIYSNMNNCPKDAIYSIMERNFGKVLI